MHSGLLNVLLSVLSLALITTGLLRYNPLLTRRVTYDYFVWASTILSLTSVYGELRRLRDKPLYSTIMPLVVGGVFVVVGRLVSIIYNYTFVLGYFNGLIGSMYTLEGFMWSILVLAGSFMVGVTNVLHAVLGGVVFVKPKPCLIDAYNGLMFIAQYVARVFEKHVVLVALAVWLVAFTYRFIPELHYWPWLIGWDTPEYVAHLMDYVERLNPFTSYYWMGGLRNTPPLLVLLLSPFTLIIDAWTIFKVYPSVAYGLLAALSSLIAVRVYERSWRVGLLAGLFTTLYILNLRISWDYQRQLLGSVVMLATIILLEEWGVVHGFKQSITAFLMLAACGLSHEVTGLVGFTLSLVLMYHGLKKGSRHSVFTGLTGAVVNALLETWYWRKPYSFIEAVGVLPPGLTVSFEHSQVVSYLVAGYGVTLPLVLIALANHGKPYIASTVTVLLLAGLSPLIAPYSSVATWYRFLIGAAPLASTLSIIGLADSVRNKWVTLLYLVIASLPGLALAYGYNWSFDYTSALREFPILFTPAPVPVDDKLLETLSFFKNNDFTGSTVIVAHPDYARYVHLAIRNPDPSRLIWVNYATNETICRIAESTGAKEIVLVAAKTPDTNTTMYKCLLDIKPVDEEHPWILVARVKENIETNTTIRETLSN
ncbi:hypothetical protein Tagg_0583 [Thermosphaera aggregans DSM 11486]|uniref:Glycosyltransferase RgtA/B/C/D-like domain-containing protein n=2 Tax=Thermosphaera aggregans TaxID=54254 RepID=D5U156_THEAM|nr:hypothetical protein Tagg_0583 [Thermosphaera aggregans DSM 11486]